MGYPFLRRFLEQGIIFQTYKSLSNHQQVFEPIHREFTLKKYLNEQIKLLHPVLCVLPYCKVVIGLLGYRLT